jgi:hypothetical protein
MQTYIDCDHLVVPGSVEPLAAVRHLPVVVYYNLEGQGGLARSPRREVCPHGRTLVPADVSAVHTAYTLRKP